MGYINIASDKILLRPTEVSDLSFVMKEEAAPANSSFVGQWSRERHIEALEDEDIKHLIIEDKKSRDVVGYIINAGFKDDNLSIELRRIVITEKGKGFGREAIRIIKELSFTSWGANRLWLDVREKNSRAQALYKSEGFIVEGLLRECIRYQGEFESIYIMSILKNEYNK